MIGKVKWQGQLAHVLLPSGLVFAGFVN
jgi:hypothetical protein